MSDEPVQFPEYIDSPPQFLFLEGDDLVPLICGGMIGTVLRFVMQSTWGMTIGILFGGILTYYYIRFKRNTLPGTLLHMLYALTGFVPLNKRFANGLTKRLDN